MDLANLVQRRRIHYYGIPRADSDATNVNTRQKHHLPDGSLLAAIDLGSNSFHLVITKIEHGEIRPVEALAEKVQLGAGLEQGILDQSAIDRGLECLGRFAQILESIEPEKIRAVGTNALRIAKNRRAFTAPAEKLLGTNIDVIYGREEARLVYLGVAHSLADDAQSRLVIDIGGGSTEFIIGERFEPRRLESLQMGCVSYNKSCFPEGVITAARVQRAYNLARLEVSHILHDFHASQWQECVGSSGTLQAIETILVTHNWSQGSITRAGLEILQKTLLSYDRFDDIDIEGLSTQRRSVIVAGVAITSALFDVLDIESMRTSKGALREGVIYDLMGRLSHEDVRERTINALTQRYAVDVDTGAIVERGARTFFTATRHRWHLAEKDWDLLHWAARTHEIGMAISHKHFNRHSAYLLRNADLPGFSQQEQERLAILVQGHRGRISEGLWSEVPEQEQLHMLRMVTIMRLASVFKYVEKLEQMPEFTIAVKDNSIALDFPEGWLASHPLTAQELEQQQQALTKHPIRLFFN